MSGIIRKLIDTLGTAANPVMTRPAVPLSSDAWGREKAVFDVSLLHGTFTTGIPRSTWNEKINGVETPQTTPLINCSTVDGLLIVKAGAALNNKTVLDTFRSPRYEPNRGHLYSNSMILPNPSAAGIRDIGIFTEFNGVFFRQKADGLYACREYSTGVSVTTVEELIPPENLPQWYDPECGNIYDIQMQLRGVGDYKFYIGDEASGLSAVVYHMRMLNKLKRLSISNFSLPLAFRCVNLGDNVEIHSGCADLSSEGGSDRNTTYGSLSCPTLSGQVPISGYNVPVLVVRNKKTLNGLRNVRDIHALSLTAYADQRAVVRVWVTRDPTAITLNNQTWQNYGDGFIEYLWYDEPNVATPISFDTTKASPPTFGARINMDETFTTPATFDGTTEIHQSPGDIFIFTVHRENGGACNAGITYEFGREI